MITTPQVSIIIPAYNTEKYIAKCLDSAVNQTLQNIEIIVVNDASTDRTSGIINDFKAKDNRIKVIDFEENKGNGIGRNIAIQKAKGQFLFFLDSDDWLEKDAVFLSYQNAIENSAQVVAFNFNTCYDNGRRMRRKRMEIGVSLEDINTRKFEYFLLSRKNLTSAVCQYCFSREFIISNNIIFAEKTYFEDVIFVAKSLLYSKRISYLEKPIYNYRKRKGSITQSFSKKKIINIFRIYQLLKRFMETEKIFQRYKKEFLVGFLLFCIAPIFVAYFRLHKKEKDDELQKFIIDIRKSSFMKIENLMEVRQIIKQLDESRFYKRRMKKRCRFLTSVKYNYFFTSYIQKIMYKVFGL